MLHYDASASDAGAIAWLTKDPRCKVSYNFLVMDDGTVVKVAPASARAWHAGVCRPSTEAPTYRDANSAFYGVAIAANAGEEATEAQENAVIDLCVDLYRKSGWPTIGVYRIVGHSAECWPRGRKVDPEGPDPKRPVLSVREIRDAVRGT
jgi:N-acetyl-anhydromuramyl-L-alanine amidase AmpD